MASIKEQGKRSYKITVCNGYRPNGQKRTQARTIHVPETVPRQSVKQYVYAQAEQFEKKFRYGSELDESCPFEQYARNWLAHQKQYKPTTRAGYERVLEAVYPFIGGIPLCRLRPMTLEELCENLRARQVRGRPIAEVTVQKYLEVVSAVLEDARHNDVILYNPAHRVRKPHIEKKAQRIPDRYEMDRLVAAILEQAPLYRCYYLLALATGLRRGELCALRWENLHSENMMEVVNSRTSVPGAGIVESDTKNHRKRMVALPQRVFDELGELMVYQLGQREPADRCMAPDAYIFSNEEGVPLHPDSFTRRLRKIYAELDFPQEYHLHTLRHFFASYLLQNNVSKQVTADLLGHGDTAFLERTYCHPQPESKRAAVACLDALLGGKEK